MSTIAESSTKQRAGRSSLLVAFALLALACSGCGYARIAYLNTPSLAAPTYFDNRIVHASSAPVTLPVGSPEATLHLTASEHTRYRSFDELLAAQHTRAFLVIHDDVIVYERYFHGFSAASELPAFSMSKTFAAVLVGRAVNQGLLPSLQDSVTDYIPELARKRRYGEITLERLLRMTSGIDFHEESLSGAQFYYATNLRDLMYSYDVEKKPGAHYQYGSINVQLLWDVLHRRLGKETVAHYFEQQVWGPLGAERVASWSLDSRSSGVEKFFGGFNATLRDYARLGLLFLHRGTLAGRPILPRAWVDHALSPDPVAGLVHTTDGWVRRGMYQWFLMKDGRGYFAKGYRGQYLFVAPEEHVVVVRFGEGYGNVDWTALFQRLARDLNAST
jgi:CubicO group peptidase (beta-lactamase class C family)